MPTAGGSFDRATLTALVQRTEQRGSVQAKGPENRRPKPSRRDGPCSFGSALARVSYLDPTEVVCFCQPGSWVMNTSSHDEVGMALGAGTLRLFFRLPFWFRQLQRCRVC